MERITEPIRPAFLSTIQFYQLEKSTEIVNTSNSVHYHYQQYGEKEKEEEEKDGGKITKKKEEEKAKWNEYFE